MGFAYVVLILNFVWVLWFVWFKLVFAIWCLLGLLLELFWYFQFCLGFGFNCVWLLFVGDWCLVCVMSLFFTYSVVVCMFWLLILVLGFAWWVCLYYFYYACLGWLFLRVCLLNFCESPRRVGYFECGFVAFSLFVCLRRCNWFLFGLYVRLVIFGCLWLVGF